MSKKESEDIKRILAGSGIEFKHFIHKPVFTSQESADERGLELKQGVKALVFKNGKFILALVPGDMKADAKKLSKILGLKELKLAKPEEVLKITNCEIGSVHPFGFLHDLETYMDEKVLENEIVDFNIGLHTESVAMKRGDLVKIIKPKILDFSK